MKNILQICDFAAPYRGNFVESLEAIHQSLIKKNNVQVFYLFPEKAKENAKTFAWMQELDKGNVFYFSNVFLRDVLLISEIVKKNKIGIIHSHFTSAKIDFCTHLGTIFYNPKFFKHLRNHMRLQNKLKICAASFLYHKTTCIGVSESVAIDAAKRMYGVKCIALNNAVHFERLEEYKILSRDDFCLKENSTLCLMMGFDFYRKGVDLAVLAVERLSKKKTFH
jgi:predicted DNA-binding transcriptional regulator